MVSLTLYGFCGMPIPITSGSVEHCQEKAVALLRSLKRDGYIVEVVRAGCEWETLDPEESVMVSDYSGILVIEKRRAN